MVHPRTELESEGADLKIEKVFLADLSSTVSVFGKHILYFVKNILSADLGVFWGHTRAVTEGNPQEKAMV